MEYEHKNKIKHDLEHLNEYGLISGVYKLQQKLNELDEVYAKAEAWDNLVVYLKEETPYDFFGLETLLDRMDRTLNGSGDSS